MSSRAAAQQIACRPATSVSWKLDKATLANTTIELLRSNDDSPLRPLMNEVAADAARLADTKMHRAMRWQFHAVGVQPLDVSPSVYFPATFGQVNMRRIVSPATG
jgi:hypothetical protein